MILFIFYAATLAGTVESHGFLKSPRSRNFVAAQDGVWSGGTSSTYPKESCPHCLNRGGVLAQCGMVDGRNYDANLNVFGQPMPPAPQARFSQGGEIELDVVLTAHHKGHFEFSACPIEPGGVATAACFDRYPLTFISDPLYNAPRDVNYPKRAYIAPLTRALPDNSGGLPGVFYRFRFKLPNDLSGELVLLQWHYYTANSCTYPGYSSYLFPSSWGPMQDNLSLCTNIPPDGNGTPEQFWNCAEISISNGPVPPPSSAPIPAPSPPISLPTYAPISSQTPILSPSLPPMSPTTSTTCGGGSRGNGFCNDPLLCCSQWGYCGTGTAYCGSSPPVPTPPPTTPIMTTPTMAPTTGSSQGCCSWDLGTCDFTSWCSSSSANCASCAGFYIYPSQQVGCLPMWASCSPTSKCCGHAQCLSQTPGGWSHCNLPENLGLSGSPTTQPTAQTLAPTTRKPTTRKPTTRKPTTRKPTTKKPS